MKADNRRFSTLQLEELSEIEITEIEFAPDGRIFLFGASQDVLTLIDDCGLGDPGVKSRLRPVSEVSPETECYHE